jgi:toxin ParE1/3/4
MSLSVSIRPEAEVDLAEAYQWYEERRAGLGDQFLLSVEAILDAIQRHPESFPVVHKQVRRALLRRFPYAAFYAVGDEEIVVLAFFHASRDPKRWQDRI